MESPQVTPQQIHDLWRTGKTFNEICEFTGLSLQAVMQAFNAPRKHDKETKPN
jgi:hypothetical protein